MSKSSGVGKVALDIDLRAKDILDNLLQMPELEPYVDPGFPIPKVFRGTGDIRLIILGQDPTVNVAKSRKRIHTVLNLNERGHLYRFLDGICNNLGLKMGEQVYVTNYFKNFFTERPKLIKEINLFELFKPYWLPLLLDELAEFPSAPVINLGEPVLETLVSGNANPELKYYWGYTLDWKSGQMENFRYLKPEENSLGRIIFPYPHQQSLLHPFYRDYLRAYSEYVKLQMAALTD